MADGAATPNIAENKPSKKELNRSHHALRPYGNYHNYYFHRTPVIPDARLSLLPPQLFKSKRVLDLGCNAGKLTIEAVQYLGATQATGIDIDPYLVEQAKENAQNISGAIDFLCDDFMRNSEAFFQAINGRYDTILLLSITKWLHLNHGDQGLLRLFQAIYACLPSDGILVVEPQEWANYKSAAKKNPDLRPMFKMLSMRPPFNEELESIGFRLESSLAREEGGFSRPLMIWVKG